MTQLFTASDYAKIHSIVFQPDYPGYKPNVIESPNGDGKLDTEKRYAHVAGKYLKEYTDHKPFTSKYVPGELEELAAHEYSKIVRNKNSDILSAYLDKAHDLSLQIAISIGVPKPFWPDKRYGALRVLEYGPTAVTNPHTDFDLFTLSCYRNLPEYFKYMDLVNGKTTYDDFVTLNRSSKLLKTAQELNSQIHFGEILEVIDNKTFKANPHEVVASGGAWQYSAVYFAIPSHEAKLGNGLTIKEWLDERLSRSRYEK
jgi:hypothetical protein